MANSGEGDIVFGIADDIIPIVSERIEQEKASELLFRRSSPAHLETPAALRSDGECFSQE